MLEHVCKAYGDEKLHATTFTVNGTLYWKLKYNDGKLTPINIKQIPHSGRLIRCQDNTHSWLILTNEIDGNNHLINIPGTNIKLDPYISFATITKTKDSVYLMKSAGRTYKNESGQDVTLEEIIRNQADWNIVCNATLKVLSVLEKRRPCG